MSEAPHNTDERRFRRLVDTLDHAVVWEFDDTHQKYTFVSQHSKLVLGYENDEWANDPQFFEERVHPDDLARVLEAFAKLRRRELTDVRLEHRCRRADGTTIWVHSGVHCEEESGGRVLFRGVTIDIDHLKRAEERERKARAEAERTAKARDEVLAVVAHDLRNPLNTVQLAVETLGQPEQLARGTQLIRRAVKQMQGLIDDLVDAASIRASRLRITTGAFSPVALAREVADDFAGDATERGVSLVVQVDDAAAELRGDHARIRQALSNLVNNALKFTERGGSVTLRVLVDPLQVRFEVADTGRGIAPQEVSKVFDRDWQSDETAHLGSGMGLYIAKGIIEAHGGEIKVVSALGQGSLFSVVLPR